MQFGPAAYPTQTYQFESALRHYQLNTETKLIDFMTRCDYGRTKMDGCLVTRRAGGRPEGLSTAKLAVLPSIKAAIRRRV